MDQISIINETSELIDETMILDLIKKVLTKENKTNVELNVIIVDNDYIHNLNKEYRGIDRPTDVITFAFNDTPSIIEYDYELLGEIYISFDQAKMQSIEYGHSITRELAFLVVHGMYHLLGFDHQTEAETKIMREKEEVILNERNDTKR